VKYSLFALYRLQKKFCKILSYAVVFDTPRLVILWPTDVNVRWMSAFIRFILFTIQGVDGTVMSCSQLCLDW